MMVKKAALSGAVFFAFRQQLQPALTQRLSKRLLAGFFSHDHP